MLLLEHMCVSLRGKAWQPFIQEASHLVPTPRRYREAFEALGTSLEDQGIQLDRVGPAAYRVFFGDGTRLDLLNDEAAMAAQLEGVEPGAGEGYRCGGRQQAGRHGQRIVGRRGGVPGLSSKPRSQPPQTDHAPARAPPSPRSGAS